MNIKTQRKKRQGFTIIEVTLVLALTGLLLIGALGLTYSQIQRQQYNDAVQTFTEFLRATYSAVENPEALGDGSENIDVGHSNELAIYGKVLVFGLDDGSGEHTVYSATLVGAPDLAASGGSNLASELGSVDARLFCGAGSGGDGQVSTVSSYTPTWGTKIQNTGREVMQGTVIIAHAPSSGTVQTVFTNQIYNIHNNCAAASSQLASQLKNNAGSFRAEDIDFCLQNPRFSTTFDVRIRSNATNSSAVHILDVDDGDNKCNS